MQIKLNLTGYISLTDWEYELQSTVAEISFRKSIATFCDYAKI